VLVNCCSPDKGSVEAGKVARKVFDADARFHYPLSILRSKELFLIIATIWVSENSDSVAPLHKGVSGRELLPAGAAAVAKHLRPWYLALLVLGDATVAARLGRPGVTVFATK
jgi:hypothetical protein